QRSISKGFRYGIILIDIDNFKKYNDIYGHSVGDIILQRVGTFLQESVELQSVVCRYGGDEFAIILPNTTYKQLIEMGQEIRIGVKSLNITDVCKQGGQLSLSMGFAMYPLNGDTVEHLIDHADKNLLLAKDLGKDQIIPVESP
ncbi:MAG: GGDEF domain-containing protein, partial [Spirochaetia bacterium]|nr:GGDEF domain-containing protein [Spirochaetia bacterium]